MSASGQFWGFNTAADLITLWLVKLLNLSSVCVIVALTIACAVSIVFSIVLIVVGTRLVPDLLHRNPTSCDLYVMLLSVLSSLTIMVSRLTVNQ